MSVFGKRLKAARTEVGLSQEGLGIEAGLDPMSASARMNRYEVGARSPNYDLVVSLAKVLRLPAAYFYAAREDEAELLRLYHRLPAEARRKVLDGLRAQSDKI